MAQMVKAKVLVVEDHAVVCVALLRMLNRQKDLICCGCENRVVAIIPALEKHNPDVLLLDLLLKDEDSSGLIPVVVSKFPKLHVLVFSQLDGPSQAENILKLGAQGFVSKEESPQELLTAVRAVLNGEVYLGRKLAACLVTKFIHEKPYDSACGPPSPLPLSCRELQVFQMIGSGKKTSDIAAALSLSIKTIESHRENIKRKLAVQTASELAHQAIVWVDSKVSQPFGPRE